MHTVPGTLQNSCTCATYLILYFSKQQVDFGTSEETTITLGPPVPGRQEQEEDQEQHVQRFFPAVTQHFTGGAPCPRLAADSSGSAEEKDRGRACSAGEDANSATCSRNEQREREVVSHDSVHLVVG